MNWAISRTQELNYYINWPWYCTVHIYLVIPFCKWAIVWSGNKFVQDLIVCFYVYYLSRGGLRSLTSLTQATILSLSQASTWISNATCCFILYSMVWSVRWSLVYILVGSLAICLKILFIIFNQVLCFITGVRIILYLSFSWNTAIEIWLDANKSNLMHFFLGGGGKIKWFILWMNLFSLNYY
jgi:hypothetical protein